MELQQLWCARKVDSPSNVFKALANECDHFGIVTPDVYGDFNSTPEKSWLKRFENQVSTNLGKEDAIFVPSGVMAQQIAILVHYESRCGEYHNASTEQGGNPSHSMKPRKAFVCHHTSHFLLHEQNAYSELLNFEANVIAAKPKERQQSPITFESIAPFICAETLDAPRPACAVIECPHREIGGKCTPFVDLVKISNECRKNGVALHMDGARLWEASAAYTYNNGAAVASSTDQFETLSKLCALFDSVYVSFYKGLGGLAGAMLVGDSKFIASARVWLRRFGGNLHTVLPYAVAAWRGYRDNIGEFPARLERLKHVVELITVVASKNGSSGGTDEVATAASIGPLVRFDPTVPEVSLVHVYFKVSVTVLSLAVTKAADKCGVQCVNPARLRPGQHGASDECYYEFNLGIHNGGMSDEVWELGWTTLINELHTTLASRVG